MRTPASLIVLLTLAAPTLAPVPARAGSSRPDRALYIEAKAARKRVEDSRRRSATALEWERVVVKFRTIVARYPRSAYCDDALLAIGDIYRGMAARFHKSGYLDDAVVSYVTLVREYPSSSLGEGALFAAFEIESTRRGRTHKTVATAAERYLENYPDGPHAGRVRSTMKRGRPAEALPTPPKPGLARVFDLRFWSGESSTRVVIDLERRVNYQRGRLKNPDRLFFDLLGARIHPNLKSRTFPVGDGLLQQIRVGQFNDEVVRVVLDFKDIAADTAFFRDDPVGLVVDVRAPKGKQGDTDRPEPRPAAEDGAAVRAASREQPPATTSLASPPAPRIPGGARPPAVVAEAPVPSAAPEPPPAPPATSSGSPAATPAPRPNSSGTLSIARQFGLGAHRIVIDPGHGGHDPGTIGKSGLQEKDLVLDVALRLEKLVRQQLGLDVVMTRRTDVFIPLEERTAIANTQEADLFLSIHVNASRNTRASGIETYYLNFANDPHAEEVAARENATSRATLKDLNPLVKAVMTNSKIEESRDFAASVQHAMVKRLSPVNRAVSDRGVRRAPFYVLLGANMPSILAEIAFVSHRDEEHLLRSASYRQAVARALLDGVRSYLDALHAAKPTAVRATATRQASR